MNPTLRTAAVACALAALACAPDRAGEFDAHVVAPASDSGAYALRVERVSNLESLRELRGRDFHFRAASAVIEDWTGARFDHGRPFALDWAEDENGAVLPSDLHSLLALSAYRSLDQASSYFRDRGFTLTAPLNVYFLPRYDSALLGDLRSSLTDNAAFVWEARALLLLPALALAELPLLLNQGVLAHELGHAIIHEAMFGDARELPEDGPSDRSWAVASRHLFAMHEGVADLVGFVVTGDPDFMRASLQADRDISVPRQLFAEQVRQLENPPQDALLDTFSPHPIGSVLARAVYEMWPKEVDGSVSREERDAMAELLIESLRALDYHPDRFTFGSFPSALVEARVRRISDAVAADAERQRCCRVLLSRLGSGADWLTACAGLK